MKKSLMASVLVAGFIFPAPFAYADEDVVVVPEPVIEEPEVILDPLPEPITDSDPEHCHAYGAGIRVPDWHDNLRDGECHFHIEDYDVYVPRPYTPPEEPKYVYVSDSFPYYEPPDYNTWINIPTGPNITNINNNNINNVGSGGQMSLSEMSDQYDRLLIQMLIELLMEKYGLTEDQAETLLTLRSSDATTPATIPVKQEPKQTKKKKKKKKNRR